DQPCSWRDGGLKAVARRRVPRAAVRVGFESDIRAGDIHDDLSGVVADEVVGDDVVELAAQSALTFPVATAARRIGEVAAGLDVAAHTPLARSELRAGP